MSNKNKTENKTETETETFELDPETETKTDINKTARDNLVKMLIETKMSKEQAETIALTSFPVKFSTPKAPSPNAICRALSTLAALGETEKVKDILTAHPFKTIQKRVEYTDAKKGTYNKWETSKDAWTVDAQYKEILKSA